MLPIKWFHKYGVLLYFWSCGGQTGLCVNRPLLPADVQSASVCWLVIYVPVGCSASPNHISSMHVCTYAFWAVSGRPDTASAGWLTDWLAGLFVPRPSVTFQRRLASFNRPYRARAELLFQSAHLVFISSSCPLTVMTVSSVSCSCLQLSSS